MASREEVNSFVLICAISCCAHPPPFRSLSLVPYAPSWVSYELRLLLWNQPLQGYDPQPDQKSPGAQRWRLKLVAEVDGSLCLGWATAPPP